MNNKNSVFKKALSVLLTALLLFGTVSLGIVFPETKITANAALEPVGKLAFYVPEAVYLYPDVTSWKDTVKTPFQFFITNNVKEDNIYEQPTPKAGTHATDTVYFAYEKITGTPTLSYKWVDKNGNVIDDSEGRISIETSPKTSGSSSTEMKGTNNYFTASLSTADSNAPALAADKSGCYIQWTVQFTDSTDGVKKSAYAYTYVYKPNVQSVGGAMALHNRYSSGSRGDQITWITGIHSVESAATDQYARYGTTASGTKGMAPFLSTENKGYAGSADLTGTQAQYTSGTPMYAVFASTDKASAYFWANQTNSGINNNWCGDWLTSNAQDNKFPVQSFSVREEKGEKVSIATSNHYNYANITVDSKAVINIDTSRYSNLKDIPNLGIGLLVTSRDGAEAGAWTITDYTNGSSAYRANKFEHKKKDYSHFTNAWNDGVSHGVIAGVGSLSSLNNTADDVGFKYGGAWSRDITDSNDTYSFKSFYLNCEGSKIGKDDASLATVVVDLQTNKYDKSVLRSALNEVTSKSALIGFKISGDFDSRYYDTSDATWTAFVKAYKKAFMALTVVDEALSDTPAEIAKELRDAADNLKVKVTLHNNNGAGNGYKSFATGLTELTAKAVSEFGTPVRKGYTFKGWTLTENSGDATDGKTDGTLEIGSRQKDVYATWSLNDYTVTFRAMKYGKFDSSSEDTVLHYNVAGQFTVPTNYTRDYYVFNNAWEIKQSDSTDWKVGMSLAPGFTSDIGKIGNLILEPNVTPIDYTAKFDSDGGSTVDAITYNVESTGVLPASSRTGYTFVGWSVVTSDDAKWESGKVYPAGASFKDMHGNVTLKAVWETLTSKVTLELGSDESIAGNKELTYSYSSSLMLNTPVKKGYTFLGWRVKSTSTGASWMPGHEYLLSAGETQVTLPGGMLGDVVLVPMWEAVTYEITYNSDGGTAYEKQSYTIEKTVTLPTPAKNGYVFNGWSVSVHDSDYNWTNSSYDGGASLVGMYGSVTLKANWSRASYTVKFNSDGGNVIADRAYDIENGTPNLPTPSKTAYTFVRWVVESTDPVSAWRTGEVFTDALPAGRYGNVTLKAEWKPSEYTILFSDGQQQTYTYESEFSLHTPDRAGYRFEHWTVTSSNGNWELNKTYTASDRISKMYGEVHLEAVFTPCEYTVEYQDENGNELAPASSYKTGETVTLASFSKAGYSFLGWRVKSDSDGSWGVDSIITASSVDGKYGNVVLVPELEAITYTVTYKTDGGNAVPAGTYTVETGLTLGTTEKTGHNLEKWVVESTVGNWTAGDELAPGATVSGKYGNVTLTAKWTPKIYNITFITGNGEKQVVHSAYGQETPTLPGDYSKPADARYTYTFSHWEPALARVTGDATYTAVYTETLNEYTVTWRIEQTEGSGSYSSEATTWKYGETPAYNGVPTQNPNSSDHKMRFVGWEPAITEVTGNAVYTARFVSIANPQTVKWYNGSTLLATTEWSIGEVPHYSGATPVRPDENGYRFEFVGWATTDNGDVIDPLPAIVRGQDVNYYAVFEKKAQSYTVTLDANGGSVAGGTSIGYTYAEAMTEVKLPTPEKTGYSFTGWRVDSTDGTWAVGDILTGNVRVNAYGNVTVSAQWEKITYTLTFAGEGAAVPSMTYDIESDAVLPDASKDGSELVGWLVSAGDGSWAQGTTVEVAMSLNGSYGNATLTPVYKAKTYTIKWISGDIVQTTEVQFGSAIIPYEPIPKQGYTAEWDKEVPATMPASDLEFVAVYTPIQYYLRLNLNGGTGAESFYYDSDTTDVLPIPTRDGATFVGWRVTSSSGNWNVGTLVAGGTALKGKYGNTILTAQWKFDVFTVTWVAGDETRVSKWYYGATPSFDGTPYKSPDNNYSYVFIGWDKEITTVTGDVTYTALFEKTERVYTIRWNVDGVITEQHYSYGDMPEFGGETPSRASTPEYDFFFDGWSPEVGTVTDDVTYVAQFRVFVKLQGLSLNKSAMFLDIDASESLTAEIYPSTASAKDVLWASSDASVATVDAVGKVTAVNAGIAIISVSSGDGNFKSYCVVTVAPKLTSYIEITANGVSTTNIIGTSVQLYASVKPDDATDRTFTWSSDNPGIASVDEFGMVRFNSKGTTTIRVVTSDGYAKGIIEVTSTEDKTGEETVKTYGIRFLDLACPIYLIDDNGNRHTFESNEIVCVPAGSTIRFRPARPYYVIANGVQLEQDAEYVIENVQKNYIISTSKAAIVTPEDPDDAPTFIRKLQEFFRKIVQFFKSLFGTK